MYELNPRRIATMGIGFTPISIALQGFDLQQLLLPQQDIFFKPFSRFGTSKSRLVDELKKLTVFIRMLESDVNISGVQTILYKKNKISIETELLDILKKDVDIKIEILRLK